MGGDALRFPPQEAPTLAGKHVDVADPGLGWRAETRGVQEVGQQGCSRRGSG